MALKIEISAYSWVFHESWFHNELDLLQIFVKSLFI